MGEVIVITSGKGGVGKTTSTANIGTGLAGLGKSVVIIDMDIGLRNLDVILGLENRVVYNLVDVVEGNCRISQALIRDKNHETLFLLPAAQTRDKDAVSPEQMKKLTEMLSAEYDYVLLDCPAGIEQGFLNSVAGASRAIVVTSPDVASIRDADRIISLLKGYSLKRTELLINKMRVRLMKKGEMMSPKDITEILPLPLVGVIPEDEEVVISGNNGDVVVDGRSMAGKAYKNVCRRICGETIPIVLKERRGLFRK